MALKNNFTGHVADDGAYTFLDLVSQLPPFKGDNLPNICIPYDYKNNQMFLLNTAYTLCLWDNAQLLLAWTANPETEWKSVLPYNLCVHMSAGEPSVLWSTNWTCVYELKAIYCKCFGGVRDERFRICIYNPGNTQTLRPILYVSTDYRIKFKWSRTVLYLTNI